MIGQIINGEYRIESRIGEGAFGVVYRCEEISLKRTVAIKMLGAGTVGEKELQRFLGEGRNLASLNHPNVVQIYRLGDYGGHPYIVMEYLTGTTLKDLLRSGRPPLKEGLEIMRQIASGLAAIHAKGIIHRDLSANNVMIVESGMLKILDLGLAKEIASLSTTSAESFLAGTIPYISPEQIEGRGVTFASDIFSFGVMLYETVTGQNPFEAEHYMSVLYNIAHRDPEPLDVFLENPPPALSSLVLHCVEKRPEDRPTNMREVQTSLEEILSSSGLDASRQRENATVDAAKADLLKNPYLSRVMIKRREDFYGRNQEVKRIYARLNANPPGSISIVGDRKIGKSSLLNFIYTRRNREEFLEHPEKMVMVFLDLQEQHSMSLESFVRILLGMASYELRGRLDLSDCAPNLDGVKELVQRLDRNGYHLAILLDEFETITRNPNFDLEFFSFLRYLANHYNVAYLTSSARDLQVLCHTKEISDSPFFNIFSTLRLTAFRQEEAEELIRVPSERVGHPLAPYSAQLIDLAGLFAFFLQIACSHAIEYLEERPSAEELDMNEIRSRFLEEARLHYRYIWEGFDTHERSAVLRVAKGKGVPDALRHVLEDLARRHYIVAGGSTPRLFASTFDEFLKKEGEPAAGGSFLGRLFGKKGA
jgi:serine/threonine protein kinase